jgi:hypothetical protein
LLLPPTCCLVQAGGSSIMHTCHRGGCHHGSGIMHTSAIVAAIMAQASCTLLPSWLPSWLRHHAHSCHRGCPLQAPVPPPTRRPVHTVGWCSSGGQAPACGAHGQRDGDAAQGAARAATCAHTHTHTHVGAALSSWMHQLFASELKTGCRATQTGGWYQCTIGQLTCVLLVWLISEPVWLVFKSLCDKHPSR